MWFFYALASAIFASVRRTNEKLVSQKLNHFSIGWTVQGLSLPVIGLSMLMMHDWLNPLHLPLRFWVITVIVWFAFYPLNTLCYLKAYRHGELSKVLPLQSLSPVFALLSGLVIFGQVPSLVALCAIIITVVSVYVLNMKGKRLHNPLHMFTADKPNLYMLSAIGLTTLVAVIDLIAIRASNPLYYSFVSTLGAVPVLFACARLTGVREGADIRRRFGSLAISGTFFGLSYTTSLISINSGPLAYATAVRGSGIFMGAAIGILLFKEQLTPPKLIAFVGMALGLAVFALA